MTFLANENSAFLATPFRFVKSVPDQGCSDRALLVGERPIGIRIKELTLLKPEITYKYAAGNSNLDVLQRNIERAVGHHKQKTHPSESGKKLIIKHLYVKSARAHMSAELLNSEAVSVPIPDVHLQDIGRKSDGVTAGEVTKQIFGSILQQVSTVMTAAGMHTATNTIQKAVDSATQAIKGLFK